MVDFPTSLDDLTNPASNDNLDNPSHASQHANANDILEALMAKVGIDGSAVVTSHDYLIAQNTAKRTYPSADETKLSGIEALADVTDAINVASAGALMLTGGTMSGDLTIYDPTNDGNPQFRIGSKDADEAHIQAVYDSGAQTLDYLLISTDSGGEGDICFNAASGFHGFGTTAPTHAITIATPDNAPNFFHMSGNGVAVADGFFQINNYTSANGIFAPLFYGKSNNTGYPAISFLGNVVTDTGTEPIIRFLARQSNTTVVTRPLFTFENNSNIKMAILPSGRVGIGISAPLAKLHIDQSVSDAAIPVLYLDQADVSEEMIQIASTAGVGNAIELVGAKALTTTEFIKVTINGNTRYIPAGTIA